MFYSQCHFYKQPVLRGYNTVAAGCNSAACCNKDCPCQLFFPLLSRSRNKFSLTELTLSSVSPLLPHSFCVQTQLHRHSWSKRRVLWRHELHVCGRRQVWEENRGNESHRFSSGITSLELLTIFALGICFHFTNVLCCTDMYDEQLSNGSKTCPIPTHLYNTWPYCIFKAGNRPYSTWALVQVDWGNESKLYLNPAYNDCLSYNLGSWNHLEKFFKSKPPLPVYQSVLFCIKRLYSFFIWKCNSTWTVKCTGCSWLGESSTQPSHFLSQWQAQDLAEGAH